jgi:DNA-binding CsgD family transcriptional regulator
MGRAGIASFTTARDLLVRAADSACTGEEACSEIAGAFAHVMRHDAAAVMTTDPDTHLPAGGIVSGFDASACVPFWDNELLDPDFNKFNDLARSIEPVATLAEATDGDLHRSPRHHKLYADFGASDELRVAFVAGSSCMAIAAFVRCDGEVYSALEVRDVKNLLVPATNLLRRALASTGEPLSEHGPVIVLLDADGRILSRSAEADDVLDDLRIRVDDDLPGTIMVAAARARASRSSTRLTTRLRGRSGRWVRIHVTPMEGDDGIVSVTIDEARAGDLVPILLDSYALTSRETDIVLLLCRGIGTKEIAGELSISIHTVRDHLKAVFEKAGVNSRGELVAQLFSNHVLADFHHTVAHV